MLILGVIDGTQIVTAIQLIRISFDLQLDNSWLSLDCIYTYMKIPTSTLLERQKNTLKNEMNNHKNYKKAMKEKENRWKRLKRKRKNTESIKK